MKSIWSSFLLLCMLLSSGLSLAEGGCPAGMIPYSGNDLNSCGPIPANYYGNQQQGTQQGQQNNQPPPQWKNQWLAIATDSVKGSLGSATGMSNGESAEQAAIADCQAKGGAQCKLGISVSNGCAAMAVADDGYNLNVAATADEAVKLSMKVCTNHGYKNCHYYYSACSLPVRIQ